MHDKQQGRAYQAEFRLRDFYDNAVKYDNPVIEIEGITITLPPEGKFGSIESVQRYTDSVCKMVDAKPVRIRERQGESCAHYEWPGVIAVNTSGSRWALREIVILHELAHHITRGGQAHGPEFISNFIDLLSQVMGPEVGLAFRILSAHHNVKVGV